jgi:probable phosphoglycerate mutase
MPGRAPGLHLSDAGRAEAQAVAERLATMKLDAIYSSPLERARETAAPTAAATGLTPIEEPGLIEADVGDWTGKTLASLARLNSSP